MFGSTRRKSTAFAIESVGPIISNLEIRGPLPSQFWADPYYLGYLTWTIVSFAKIKANGKLYGEDTGRCLFDTLTSVSKLNGVEIGTLATHFAERQDEAFCEGSRNAEKVFALTFGSHEFDDDPDVQAAIRKADAIGNSLDLDPKKPSSRETRIVSCLTSIVLNDRVKLQFGR